MTRKNSAIVPTPDDAKEFDVGQRLRRIRLARKLTLSKVAMSAGISEGFLSQIERGVGNASIATLRSVATVLGVEMRDLFDESSDRAHNILRKRERPILSFGEMGTKYLLTTALDRNLEVFITELNPSPLRAAQSVTKQSPLRFNTVASIKNSVVLPQTKVWLVRHSLPLRDAESNSEK